MRPLPQDSRTESHSAEQPRLATLPILALLATAACTVVGCAGSSGGAGASSVVVPPPPPAPSSITVTITPATVSLLLGNSQSFAATVTGATNTTVSWSVNDIPDGTPVTGTITSAGVYTAPIDLPLAPTVQITATSNSDPTKSAIATLTIANDVAIALTPSAVGIELGAIQPFRAAINSSGRPDSTIRRSISGPACPTACGSLDTSGNYTAPQILPALATVTIIAQSVADPASGGSGVITATFTPVPGSNPSATLSWTLSGAGCTGTSQRPRRQHYLHRQRARRCRRNRPTARRLRYHSPYPASLRRRPSRRAHALHSKHKSRQDRRHRRTGGAVMNFVQRRRFLWICLLIGLLLLGLTAAFASATTFARFRFEDLARQSTAVARLRCLGSEFRWDRGELWTETRFEVLERNKGLLSGIVTVRTIGGTSGHVHSHVDGVPVFRPGEEVYLFLWERPGEPCRVLGWAQGTFRIARNADTGTETVTQDSAPVPFFDPRTRTFRHGGIRNLPVGIFQLKLRRALEQRDKRELPARNPWALHCGNSRLGQGVGALAPT